MKQYQGEPLILSIRRDRNRLVLCDERGGIMPGQCETQLQSTTMGLTTFTVTFNVAGNVLFEPDREAGVPDDVVSEEVFAERLREALAGWSPPKLGDRQ